MADDEKPDEQNQADRQGLVTGRHVGIQPVEIRDEIQNAYLDYAMSVIVGRALPDVRDGLKPVHRRVIYAMYDGGYRPDRGYGLAHPRTGLVVVPWCLVGLRHPSSRRRGDVVRAACGGVLWPSLPRLAARIPGSSSFSVSQVAIAARHPASQVVASH